MPALRPTRRISSLVSIHAIIATLEKGRRFLLRYVRLAGTLPTTVLQQCKQERDQILQHALAAKRPLTWQEQEELFRWYSARVDAYLDAGHGDCFFVSRKSPNWLPTR